MSRQLASALRAVLIEVAAMKLDRLHPLSIQAQNAHADLDRLAAQAQFDNWTPGSAVVEVSRGHRVGYVHSGDEIIAQVWCPAGGTDADTLALTAKIAATPRLLRLLDAAHARLEELGDARDGSNLFNEIGCAIDAPQGEDY